MTTTKRRPRRIAADEAHSWARNLKLGNIHAKLVLSMLTLYVDVEGWAYVGIPTLADDCELSADTVRRRLAWLEEIGAISRRAQWIDENGRRNGEGKGKRTTDLIRLLIEADADEIEAHAAGRVTPEISAVSTAFSPSCQPGLNRDENPVSPLPALGQPSHCGEGLISEPEPESSPLPPSRGESGASRVEESEPEHFGPAWSEYPGHAAMRRDLALHEFRLLPIEKQRLCRAAVPLYRATLAKLRRNSPMNFHLWIRARGFDEFPNATLPEDRPAMPERRFVQGDELAGLIVATRIAERREPAIVEERDRGKGVWTRKPVEPDLAAMAMFVDADHDRYEIVDEGLAQFAAWRDRLALWLGRDVKAERIWLEPYDPAVHGLSATNPDFKLRKSKHGLRVPAPWPPRRDGSWGPTGETE